jgi:4'-phosphopantetheinyl transferase
MIMTPHGYPLDSSVVLLPLESLFAVRQIEVLVRRLDATPEAVGSLALRLSEAERERASRFRFYRDRRRFIVARARLRELLGVRLGVPPESVELACGKNGKPALAARCAGEGLRFNVSHCEDVAVYAFSRGCEVGIDVEAIRTLPAAESIAARVFSPRENRAFLALAPRDRALGFFNCWTRKEALVKALGIGLAVRLDQLDVSESRLGEDGAWHLESFFPLPGFIGAVASHPG